MIDFWLTANGATIFSQTSTGAITFEPLVIPSEVEESLAIVWPWFPQKYLEMSRLRST